MNGDVRRVRSSRFVQDHWRETADAWRPGRRRLAWHLTFEAQPELGRLGRTLGPHFEQDFLSPVAPRWLHREIEPIELRLGPPDAMRTAVALPASPVEPIERLRGRLRDADLAVRGERAAPPVAVRAANVVLLRLRRDYTWDALATLALGS